MAHLDVSVIQIQRGVQVAIDDIKEWILAILLFPIIILLIFAFYLFFVVPMLIAIVIDWWIAIPYERRNGNKNKKTTFRKL
jgi:hypothetical protein